MIPSAPAVVTGVLAADGAGPGHRAVLPRRHRPEELNIATRADNAARSSSAASAGRGRTCRLWSGHRTLLQQAQQFRAVATDGGPICQLRAPPPPMTATKAPPCSPAPRRHAARRPWHRGHTPAGLARARPVTPYPA